jgi:hypothetical protein
MLFLHTFNSTKLKYFKFTVMKKTFIQSAMIFAMAAIVGCGSMPSVSKETSSPATNTTSAQTSGLGTLLGGLTNGGSSDTNSLISGVVGQLVGGLVVPKTIEGSWVYAEPTIQFESENLLAKAGGAMATEKIIEKAKPYYEKIGIVKGSIAIEFNSDNTCSYTFGGNTYDGTYVYNKETNVVEFNDPYGMKIITAYATVSSKNLAISFDATKLLTLFQTLGASSSNTTIASLTALSKSFTGMKVGFLFDKE